MDGLPEELLLNILHRLSVKSIGSCMCVNKNLHSIIKNPYFVSSYTNIRNNVDDKDNQYLIFWKASERQFELRHENDTFELYKQFNILPIEDICYYHPICNGMLCLRRGTDVILWNPTIKKLLTLPRSSSGLSAVNVAFWFDSLTNDYKVIKIPFYNLSSVEVFSLNNNQWKDVSQIAPELSIDYNVSPPVFNGTLNWIGRHSMPDRRNLAILSFDVNVEVFQTIELPDVVRRYSQIANLLLYKETSIAVCCLIYDDLFDEYINRPAHPEIWAMKEYGNAESWFNLWTYDESQFPVGGTSLLYGDSRAIGVLNNGHVLWEVYGSMNLEVHVPNESKMIISTDPETGEYYGLAFFPHTYFSHRDVVTYFGESLVLLDKV